MQIPDTELDDFMRSWKHAFKEELSRDDARLRAHELLMLYRDLARPPPTTTPHVPPAEDARD